MPFKIIESIVDKRDINNDDNWEQTPLHFAAEKKLVSVCQKWMEIVPEEVNCKDANGNTPFHLAAQCGHLERCELFIKNFDDLNAQNYIGYIPFHLAAYNGHLAVCNLIIKVHHSKF